jgi:hypothetical protein
MTNIVVSRKEMAEIRERVRLGLPVAAFLVEKLLRVIDLGRTADALRNEGGDDED